MKAAAMIAAITDLLRPPTPAELARRALAEHQRELIRDRRILQAATACVRGHEACIADLRRTLEQLQQEEQS